MAAASTEEGGKGGTGDSKGVVLRVTQVRFEIILL